MLIVVGNGSERKKWRKENRCERETFFFIFCIKFLESNEISSMEYLVIDYLIHFYYLFFQFLFDNRTLAIIKQELNNVERKKKR